MPPGCELVGYADDVILITRDTDPVKTKSRVEKSLNIICNWLLKNDLELAHEKTEAIIITNRRVKIEFSLNNHTIVPAKTVKYLGMYIDRNLQFSSHIRLSCVKAEKCIRAVTCLLGNTYGPPSQKRRVLAHACQSILLYGAPLWAKGLRIERNRQLVLKTQRTMAVRICMGYRTISTDAALVLARLIPIDLLAQERKRLDEYKSKNTKLTDSIRNMERKITINSWQHRWSEGSNAQWTKRFITDIQWWTEKESKINHYTTQWLTGHGSFKKY